MDELGLKLKLPIIKSADKSKDLLTKLLKSHFVFDGKFYSSDFRTFLVNIFKLFS